MARPSQGIAQGVVVRATIPTEVDAAINSLVAMSGGISKSTFIRQALLAGLQPYAITSPEIAGALAVTKQSVNPNQKVK